jgi:hypothetical protein
VESRLGATRRVPGGGIVPGSGEQLRSANGGN